MATSLVNLPAYFSGDADFRTWGSGLAAQLAAVGMVQTADTGQINWVTVNRPAANASAGFEIWRFDDTQQANMPLYLKVEYGCSATTDRPRLWVTIGTGSNGSGTITGQATSQLLMGVGASKTASAVLPSYVSAGEGWLHIATNMNSSTSTYRMLLFIDRSMDSTGTTPTDYGVLVTYNNSATGTAVPMSFVIPKSGTVASGQLNPWPPVTMMSTAGGSNAALIPTVWAAQGKVSHSRLLAYLHTDIGEFSSITLTYQGATRTYMPLGDGSVALASTDSAVAMLWE